MVLHHQTKTVEIQQLLDEADALDERIQAWQAHETAPSASEILDAHQAYRVWLTRARHLVAAEDQEPLVQMYEGNLFTPRIRGFFDDPMGLSPLYQPENPAIFSKWSHPFVSSFRANLGRQRDLLTKALHNAVEPARVLDDLGSTLRRLPEYLSVLKRSKSDNVRSHDIKNEADLQVVVHALLRLLFDDVRPEDFVPQRAGASSRVDFLLQDVGVIVETKMTRPGLSDRKLGEELLTDWGRYPGHPNCRGILALVFDPERRLANPTAIETDLSDPRAMPPTKVIVIR